MRETIYSICGAECSREEVDRVCVFIRISDENTHTHILSHTPNTRNTRIQTRHSRRVKPNA